MSDIDLIYSACCRAERRLEEIAAGVTDNATAAEAIGFIARLTVQTLREEIGRELARLHTENRP